MVVTAILSCEFTSWDILLDVTLSKSGDYLVERRKYVVVANKSSVVTKSVTTKNLLLNKRHSYLKFKT